MLIGLSLQVLYAEGNHYTGLHFHTKQTTPFRVGSLVCKMSTGIYGRGPTGLVIGVILIKPNVRSQPRPEACKITEYIHQFFCAKYVPSGWALKYMRTRAKAQGRI